MIAPFDIPLSLDAVEDLRRRLRDTRWNDAVTTDWTYGVERAFLLEIERIDREAKLVLRVPSVLG